MQSVTNSLLCQNEGLDRNTKGGAAERNLLSEIGNLAPPGGMDQYLPILGYVVNKKEWLIKISRRQ